MTFITNRPIAQLNVRDFGALGDGSTDDSSAIQAAIEALSTQTYPNGPGGSIYLPPGTYRCNKTIHINSCIDFHGASGSGQLGSTTLSFPPGVDGVIVHSNQTAPDAGYAGWATIRDMRILSPNPITTFCHGVRLYATANLKSLYINNFGGDGIHIDCNGAAASDQPVTAWAPSYSYIVGNTVSNDAGKWYICKVAGTSAGSGGPTGTASTIVDGGVTWGYVSGTNANNWRIDYCKITANGRHGLWVAGPDSNAGLATGVNCSDNGGWGIYDASFLGNTYVGCHTDSNALGPYNSTGVNSRNMFVGCYAETGGPPSAIDSPASVIGGIFGSGITGTYCGLIDGTTRTIQFQSTGGGYRYVGDKQNNGDIDYIMSATGVAQLTQTLYPYSNASVKQAAIWRISNSDQFTSWGTAFESSSMSVDGNRYLRPAQLFTLPGYGIMNEGKRICHSDTPTSIDDTFMPGDLVFARNPSAGESVGWVCTSQGRNGPYSGGLTATANGTTTITLSAGTPYYLGLQEGNRLLINGVTSANITNVALDRVTLTMSTAIPAGSGLSIDYVNPTFVPFGAITGGAADSTGAPGDATQHAVKGRVAMAIGAAALTVTNSKVTSTSIITAILQTNDATCTAIQSVIPAAGSFVIQCNFNATTTTNICWKLEE